ncbi:ANTAR domain-containing protein [Nakamurella deserti]|uniref:ANTAR domain-containing protein n=1 Tax=Nakamurella deserti TaxID=2164074 RepID=UPI0014788ABE|nr:ANTAR domain-containing protein [Nakamurella deserti]
MAGSELRDPDRPTSMNPSSASFVVTGDRPGLSAATGLARLLGFGDGHDPVTTTAAWSAHLPPLDRDLWSARAEECRSSGTPAVLRHRLRTADGGERVVCSTFVPAAGVPGGVHVVVADLTDEVREAARAQTREAVSRATQTREVIDQAKGIMMVVLDLDAEQAFDLLRWHSSRANVKLRDICAAVIDAMAAGATATAPRQRLAGVFAALGSTSTPRPGWTRSAGQSRSAAAEAAESASHIPAALLPGILTRAVADAAVSITVADMTVPHRPLVYVNPAFERLTGYAAADVLGRNCRFLQGDHTNDEQNQAIREAMRDGRSTDTLIRNFTADGTPFWNEFHLSPVRNVHGRLTHYIGYQLDVTERVEREEQLRRLAFEDAATGLPNRAAALRHVEDLRSAATPFTVATVSSDRFGDGDALDHSDGRVVTMLAAQRLRAAAPDAYLARTGAHSLQLIGSLPAQAALEQALHAPAGTVDDDVRLDATVTMSTSAAPTAPRSS